MTIENRESELPKQERQPIWKLLIALVLGAGLLYLAFKDCNLELTIQYMKEVNPVFVCMVFCTGVFSHFLRAVRWVILLKPVAERNVSLWHSFYAVILGYAVNVAIPRGGEVVRLVEISRLEKLPWAGVMPTMLIDRLIDFVMLAFLVGLTLTVLPKQLLESLPWLVPGGVAMLVGATVALLALPKLSVIIRFFLALAFIKKALPERIMQIVEGKLDEFDKGARCLSNPVTYPLIAGLSVLMWGIYWLNFFLMLFAFSLQNRVSATDCLIAFTIGTVGVLVPTPGSAGGFHLLVQKGLVLTSGLELERALAFATVLHLMAFVIVTVVPAAICMLVQSARKKRA